MEVNSPKVVVIGGAHIDMVLKCDQVPIPGESITGSALAYTSAGPGPNQAVQAALCGCKVHLISKIGGDPFGAMVKSTLAEFAVNAEFIYTADAKNTGMFVTFVNNEGENATCTYAGANIALGPRDIELSEDIISFADVCLIHGQLPEQAIVKAIRCAKLHGTKVILNPARPMDHRENSLTTLPDEYFNVDVLIPNLYEAADITEHSAANINTSKLIGSDMVARGVDSAVITMGKRGCMVVDRSGADHIPAFDIELIDQTCTGDAFAGALAAHYAVGNNIREATKFASAAGALVCTKFGSIEALPTKADIIQLLQKEEDAE